MKAKYDKINQKRTANARDFKAHKKGGFGNFK